MTTRLSVHVHVFPTITFDSKTLHVCKQQQKFSDTLVSDWLMAVPMTIRLGTHVSLTITSDATPFQPCKQQQIASGNKLLFVIL